MTQKDIDNANDLALGSEDFQRGCDCPVSQCIRRTLKLKRDNVHSDLREIIISFTNVNDSWRMDAIAHAPENVSQFIRQWDGGIDRVKPIYFTLEFINPN